MSSEEAITPEVQAELDQAETAHDLKLAKLTAVALLLEQLPSSSTWVGTGGAAVQIHGYHYSQIVDRFRYVDFIFSHVVPGKSVYNLMKPLGRDVKAWFRTLAQLGLVVLDFSPEEQVTVILITRKGYDWLQAWKAKLA